MRSRSVEVSNPEKLYFPDDGITKGDVVEYYRRVADRMVPHLRDRPLVMHRFPEGIEGHGFFQKDAPRHFPGWVRTARLPKEGGAVRYVVADDEATLVYLAGQGCLTPHVLLSSAGRPRHPVELNFDLDPSDDDGASVPFAARALRRVLDELELDGFVNSSGSRGLHVHVPLDGEADFDATRPFTKAVGDLLAARHPDRITTEHRKADRRGRLFMDTLRNSYGQHAVAPYAVRDRPGAPVAVPLDWDESTSAGFDPRRITIANVFRRLAQKEDPWADMARAAASLSAARTRLEGLVSEQRG